MTAFRCRASRSGLLAAERPSRLAVAVKKDSTETEGQAVLTIGRAEAARQMLRYARRYGVPILESPGLAETLATEADTRHRDTQGREERSGFHSIPKIGSSLRPRQSRREKY